MTPASIQCRSKARRMAAAFCCTLVTLAALAALPVCQAEELRVSAQIGTEPKFFNDDTGRIIGLCTDIMRAIERIEPGLTFTGDQRWMPLTRMLSELASGEQDAACGMQHTAERDRQFIYLEPPLFSVDYVLIARRDDPVEIQSWGDLRLLQPPPVVLVNRGFAVSVTLAGIPGIQIDASATDTKLNLEKLVAGRGRLFFHRGPGLQRMLERAGVAAKVRVLQGSLLHTQSYFIVGKHVGAATMERLRQALALLEKTGELQALLKKWS
jgi:polar amino acid transport system substrate-binding protein